MSIFFKLLVCDDGSYGDDCKFKCGQCEGLDSCDKTFVHLEVKLLCTKANIEDLTRETIFIFSIRVIM